MVKPSEAMAAGLCPGCGGTGRVNRVGPYDDMFPCSTCGGDGRWPPLDWREAVRLPLDPAAIEWKLYVRLFDEIDREFDGKTSGTMPFVQIKLDPDGKTLVLQADPKALP